MKDSMGKVLSLLDSDSVEETTHDRVAEHPGHKVENFTQLTDALAQLNFYNQNLSLFFRGQTKDHRIKRPHENERTESQKLCAAFGRDTWNDSLPHSEWPVCET